MTSLVALLFYRAPLGHGPDMVVQEVLAFMTPIMVAALIAVALLALAPSIERGNWRFIAVTVLLGIVEPIIYAAFLM